MSTAEKVLVFPADLLNKMPPFDGITTDTVPYIQSIAACRDVQFRSRAEVEDDPSWKQIIPYVIVRCPNPDAEGGYEYLSYIRTRDSNESRLRGKFSLGIGGHVSEDEAFDGNPAISKSTIRWLWDRAAWRELREEVDCDIDDSRDMELVACLYNSLTPVGRVHFGIVYIVDATSFRVEPRETAVALPGFMDLPLIRHFYDKYEDWSQFVIRGLLKQPHEG